MLREEEHRPRRYLAGQSERHRGGLRLISALDERGVGTHARRADKTASGNSDG